MTVESYFFVATDPVLAKHFAGWKTVKPKPVIKKVVNPFNPHSGESLTLSLWKPDKTIGKGKSNPFQTLEELEPVTIKKLDPVVFARLGSVLTGVAYEEMLQALKKPALMPFDEEINELNEVPDSVVKALVALEVKGLSEAVEKWLKAKEVKAGKWNAMGCARAIKALRDLSVKAQKDGGRVYFILEY